MIVNPQPAKNDGHTYEYQAVYVEGQGYVYRVLKNGLAYDVSKAFRTFDECIKALVTWQMDRGIENE